jgi:pilus assembly protein CpaE
MAENSVLIIDSDRASVNWLENLLVRKEFSVTIATNGRDGITLVSNTQPDLIILDMNLEDIAGEQVIEAIQQGGDSMIPIIVFSVVKDLLGISRLFQLGITDFVQKKPGIENELLGKCATSLIRAKSSIGLRPKGKLISFFSAKGGNGTSTLCLNLANSLADQIQPKTVLVVDLVLPLGSAAIMTGVAHQGSIASLTVDRQSLDTQKLKDYLLPVENWSISIMPGSESLLDSQKLDPSQIVPILSTLLRAFDYVFVDLGKTFSRISQSVLDYSNAIAVVVGPDILTAELTQIALKYLESLGIEDEKLFLILNRAVGLAGLTKIEMEDRIGKPIQRTVRYARENFTLASNQHVQYSTQFPNDSLNMELKSLSNLLVGFIPQQ